jgi:hypothetical protein
MATPKRAAVRPSQSTLIDPHHRGQEPVVMTETSTLNLPVFYTCTAATPDGPPLEIAWGSLALGTYGVMCGSHLVRPPAAWISELARDAAALRPYGLALSDLRQFGTPPHEIAAHMNEALTQREFFSVVPEDDARIRRIFDAAKMAPGFALRITDADELIAELARLQRLSHTATARARREAEVMCLTGIRAEAKVRFLATYWGLVAWQN